MLDSIEKIADASTQIADAVSGGIGCLLVLLGLWLVARVFGVIE